MLKKILPNGEEILIAECERNSGVSTAGATKCTASEVPVISTTEENISTAEENISTLEELLLTEEGVKRKGQEKTREKQ
ncbi:hypothetical protein Tco_1029676 [Tanacetum coccineum]|uniref:Uncharacterized protein n=1 Tax=Tanacetum coccineum TaxID=301880 RepID=A0ABQ5G4E5_9ASTR